MKANKSILRIPPLKYAMAIILPTIASAAFARPEASQDIDTVRVEIIDNLVVKSQAPESPELLEDVTDKGDDESFNAPEAPKLDIGTPYSARDTLALISGYPRSIYSKPASWTYSDPWWHGMWINTAVLTGAFVGTLSAAAFPRKIPFFNSLLMTPPPFCLS